MNRITIFIPKYHMAKCNRVRWKYNHHKKPRYLLSEINKAIRTSEDGFIMKVMFKEHFNAIYKFKRRI